MARPAPLYERIHNLGNRLGAVRERIVAGGSSEFERAQILRALREAEQECHTVGHQVGQMLALIVAAGDDTGPNTGPGGGGRAA